MIPFLPGRRRPDDPASRAHARAIELAAERISEPLPPEEDAWLGGHLAECEACSAIAAEYEADSRLLRAMPALEAPRDLWARTSAAIQADTPRRGSARLHAGPLVPLGALSGALVVGVVVLASLLSSPGVPPVTPSSQPLPSVAIASTSPAATPIAVVAGDVGWVMQRQDGTYDMAYAPVQHVCSAASQADCAPLAPASPVALALQAAPGAIVGAPDAHQLVVVDSATKTTGGSLYVVDLPSPAPSPAATASASASASASPGASTGPSVPPSRSPAPSDSASPSASASPSGTSPTLAIASGVVVVGETGAYSPDGRWFAFSARPADGAQGPDIYVWTAGEAAAYPVTSDHRSVFAGWAGANIIGSRAVVLPAAEGASASPQPSPDASTGPSPAPSATEAPGAASAAPSAPDAGSPTAAPDPDAVARPVSFVLDPATRASADIPGDAMWRPVVDPTGTYAAYWQGTLQLAPNGVDWVPGAGRLVVARWTGAGVVPPADQSATASASPDSGASAPATSPAGSEPPAVASPAEATSLAPATSPAESASAGPSASVAPSVSPWPAQLPVALTDGPVREWEIHWDETGTRLAVWLADAVDPTIGTLSLHTLDRTSDMLDPGGILLDQQTALPGLSIGDGRLAWATPPGQGGQDSQVQVLAWTGASAGRIESVPGPGPGPVVVIR